MAGLYKKVSEEDIIELIRLLNKFWSTIKKDSQKVAFLRCSCNTSFRIEKLDEDVFDFDYYCRHCKKYKHAFEISIDSDMNSISYTSLMSLTQRLQSFDDTP